MDRWKIMDECELIQSMSLDFFKCSLDNNKDKTRLVQLVHKVINMGPKYTVMFIVYLGEITSVFRDYMVEQQPDNKAHVVQMLKKLNATNYDPQFGRLSDNKGQTTMDDFSKR